MRFRTLVLLSSVTGLMLSTPAAPANPSAQRSAEAELHAWANTERAARGLPRFKRDGRLDGIARGWAQHMADTQSFGHSPSASSRTHGLGYRASGENVAVIGGDGKVAFELHSGWMSSAGHRTNMLQPGFDAVGYGVACGRYRGLVALYAVANFGGDGQGMTKATPPSAPRAASGRGTPTSACLGRADSVPEAVDEAPGAPPAAPVQRPSRLRIPATPIPTAAPTPDPPPTPEPTPEPTPVPEPLPVQAQAGPQPVAVPASDRAAADPLGILVAVGMTALCSAIVLRTTRPAAHGRRKGDGW